MNDATRNSSLAVPDVTGAERAADGANAGPIIQFKDVHKAFGPKVVLAGVTADIQRRKNTVIIGKSGTGKSVLLKHIVGLLQPDAGEVWFDGQRVDTLSERSLTPIRRRVSFVFQLNALFDSMSVGENIAFPMAQNPRGRRAGRKRINEMVSECLGLVGLAGYESKNPAELSGGEKKRVALARAIAMDPPPDVILYDEPTTGLDPQRSDSINKLIRRLQDTTHATGIIVTHDMRSAAEVGDRILMLNEGRIVADGTPDEIMNSSDDRVRRFVQGEADPDETPG
ncbi:MAG: ABC transporter ATP-binding protein [Phycisphaerales bacterium]|nr:ABC transporter ATP-binding protein [Phycisphaerales bacterium]